MSIPFGPICKQGSPESQAHPALEWNRELKAAAKSRRCARLLRDDEPHTRGSTRRSQKFLPAVYEGGQGLLLISD